VSWRPQIIDRLAASAPTKSPPIIKVLAGTVNFCNRYTGKHLPAARLRASVCLRDFFREAALAAVIDGGYL
jgi:hypothetical protein